MIDFYRKNVNNNDFQWTAIIKDSYVTFKLGCINEQSSLDYPPPFYLADCEDDLKHMT